MVTVGVNQMRWLLNFMANVVIGLEHAHTQQNNT